MKRFLLLAPWLAILLVATTVRLPPLTAGLPYMSYVDEGHVLHHVVHLLAQSTWEPNTYSYPSLPFYLIAGAALAWSPGYAVLHGHPLRADLSPAPPEHYEIVEPQDLIVLGRLVTLAFSLGIVVLTGLLARRLAGPAAGLLAAWLAALVPALVARSVVVNINPIATFFTLACLLFAERVRDGGKPRRDAILGGAMAGLAAASKYPAAVVFLPLGLAVLLAPAAWSERLRRLALAGGAALLAAVLAMPALILRTERVFDGLNRMSRVYAAQRLGGYWDQAVRRAEWDLPLEHPEVGIVLLSLAAAGLGVALRDRRWSRPVWGWLLFGGATGLLVAPYKFRAFRNLLSLVPVACMLVALLYAWLRRAVPRPFWVDLAAAVLPVVLFAPALHGYLRYHLKLEDSREQAMHWLAGHLSPADRVLFGSELGFVPARLTRLRVAEVEVKPWPIAKRHILKRRFQYVVMAAIVERDGQPTISRAEGRQILRSYAVAARFGQRPTPRSSGRFSANEEIVFILKRVRRRAPRPPAAAAPTASPRPGLALALPGWKWQIDRQLRSSRSSTRRPASRASGSSLAGSVRQLPGRAAKAW